MSGPSVKDPEPHEDRGAVARMGGPYEEWTKDELERRAAEVGIEGRPGMDKAELIDALRNR
jgi:hypothetical protein